jgi:hypothetical protein
MSSRRGIQIDRNFEQREKEFGAIVLSAEFASKITVQISL